MNRPEQNRIRNLVEGARNGNMPELPQPQQQQVPPLNMQIQHAAVAIANMGAMEGLPSLGPQLDKWEEAMALAPPNEADQMIVRLGRVLATAQESLRAILKAQAPVATTEQEALPEAPTGLEGDVAEARGRRAEWARAVKIIILCSREEGLALDDSKVQDFVIDQSRAYFDALRDQANIAEDGDEPYIVMSVDPDLIAAVARS